MPTVADVEAVLDDLCGGYLDALKLAHTGVSPVRFYRAPILTGYRSIGLTPANPLAVTDAEITAIPAASWAQFLDVAELRVLETAALVFSVRAKVLRNPDVRVDLNTTALLTAVKEKRAFVQAVYHYGSVADASVGVVRIGSGGVGGGTAEF